MTVDEPSLSAIAELIDRAFRFDYGAQVRPVYDRTFLARLMNLPGSVAATVVHEGKMVAFELALERELWACGRVQQAHYALLFAVAPEARRRGFGRKCLDALHQQVLERGSQLIFSTFESGRAGSLAVRSHLQGVSDWQLRLLPSPSTWWRRLDREVPSFEFPPPSFEVEPNTVDRVVAAHELAFTMRKTFDMKYLGDLNAGILRPDPEAHVLFKLIPLARASGAARLSGQIQAIHAPSDRIRDLVERSCVFFRTAGCFLATVLQGPSMTDELLLGLGFTRSESAVHFAIRGPAHLVDAIAQARPPYWVDSM